MELREIVWYRSEELPGFLPPTADTLRHRIGGWLVRVELLPRGCGEEGSGLGTRRGSGLVGVRGSERGGRDARRDAPLRAKD